MRKRLRQFKQAFRLIVSNCLRHRLRQRDAMQQGRHILQGGFKCDAARGHIVGNFKQCGPILFFQCLQYLEQIALVDCAQHAAHRSLFNFSEGEGNRLIHQA